MQVNLTSEFLHIGKQYANQTLDWLPTDTEENYLNNCRRPEYVEYIKHNGWDSPDAITYRINSLGFRGPEINFDQPCLLAVGCSYTVGIGLPEQDVWPWLVGEKLNLPVVNLSWGGYSADTCFRLAEYFLPKLKVALCVMVAPPPDRIEIIESTDSFEIFSPQTNMSSGDAYLKHWMLESENSRLNTLKNKLGVKMLCSQLSVPCLTYDAFKHFSKSREEVGYARDYMHAGPVGHQMLADDIIKDYE